METQYSFNDILCLINYYNISENTSIKETLKINSKEKY